MNIQDIEAEREKHIKEFPVVIDFKVVCHEKIQGLSPRLDLEFSIELTRGSVSASKAPYHMSAPELVELKLKLQELIEKGYI